MIGVVAVVLHRDQGGDTAHDLVGISPQPSMAFPRINFGKPERLPNMHREGWAAQPTPAGPGPFGAVDPDGDKRDMRFMRKIDGACLTARQCPGFTASAFWCHPEDIAVLEPLDRFGDGVAIDLPAFDEDPARQFKKGAKEGVVLVFLRSPASDILASKQAKHEG